MRREDSGLDFNQATFQYLRHAGFSLARGMTVATMLQGHLGAILRFCLVSLASFFLLASVAPASAQGHPPLAIGAAAPDFNLPGVDGKNHKLADYSKAKVLVIVMQSDHAPESQLYEARIRKIFRDYRDKGVAVVAISPDNPDAVPLSEMAYTDLGDSLDDMKASAEYRHIDWPYLYDGDQQVVATALGASAIPEIFIFDQARKLQYRGRIDDNRDESQVKSRDARNVIEALLAGQPVPVGSTEARGVAIAWASNSVETKQELARIEAEPVSVALASKEELGKLRTNTTGKYLLINFWATWCGPCVGEFPDLQQTFRMYRQRDFAFVTVSENDPDEKKGVLEFLQKEHATGPNLLFIDSDVYAMQAAFDPATPGAVPFTLLLAPNGDVLYQQTGDLDIQKVRRAILANLPDTEQYPGEQAYWANKASQ